MKKNLFKFKTSCVDLPQSDVPALDRMIDNATEITWKAFLQHVDFGEIKYLFDHYDWNGKGLHIKDDYTVQFYRSTYKGKECVYLVHSAIEYIWVEV